MIQNVDRATCQMLGRELEQAIDEVLKRHGFERGRTNRTYGEYFGLKIQATRIGAEKPEASDWKRYAPLFNLPEDAIGKTISMGGRQFEISGLNTRAPKNPVMLREINSGKSFKAPASSVLFALRMTNGS
jgi:hypothetical protein